MNERGQVKKINSQQFNLYYIVGINNINMQNIDFYILNSGLKTWIKMEKLNHYLCVCDLYSFDLEQK